MLPAAQSDSRAPARGSPFCPFEGNPSSGSRAKTNLMTFQEPNTPLQKCLLFRQAWEGRTRTGRTARRVRCSWGTARTPGRQSYRFGPGLAAQLVERKVRNGSEEEEERGDNSRPDRRAGAEPGRRTGCYGVRRGERSYPAAAGEGHPGKLCRLQPGDWRVRPVDSGHERWSDEWRQAG